MRQRAKGGELRAKGSVLRTRDLGDGRWEMGRDKRRQVSGLSHQESGFSSQ